jgi:hypothetical protein
MKARAIAWITITALLVNLIGAGLPRRSAAAAPSPEAETIPIGDETAWYDRLAVAEPAASVTVAGRFRCR